MTRSSERTGRRFRPGGTWPCFLQRRRYASTARTRRAEWHGLGGDPALALIAGVVHGADVPEDADETPRSRGLVAIARGVMHRTLTGHDQLQAELPVHDVLHAWARVEVAAREDARR